MRYVIETIDRNGDEKDITVEKYTSEDDANVAFEEATSGAAEGVWRKTVLWIEFDSTDEAPANDGCCYRLIDTNGKKTLRRCSAAQG